MLRHLSANLWLLALTLLICAVLYPLVLLGVGQAVFPDRANGSLLTDAEGRPVGSRLVAQPFSGDEYFRPRPSAVSYNAAAAGASNLGANNPSLRGRVLAQLGTVLKYGPRGPRPGQPVGPDVETWFQGQPGIVAKWAEQNPDAARAWVKAGEPNARLVEAWMKDHPDEVALWAKANPGAEGPRPEDLAGPFFAWYSRAHPGTWPTAEEDRLKPVKTGTDIQGNFYPLWREAHPQADLEPVPADLVMTSGSGLDPHITLKAAHYQLDRVAAAWAEKTKAPRERVAEEVRAILEEKKEAPLGGLVGVDLVNVLEVNLALAERMPRLSQSR